MPRVPEHPKRDDFTSPEDLEAYDFVVSRFRKPTTAPGDESDVIPYFRLLLNSPLWAAPLARMGANVRTAGDRGDSYTHKDREWVDQVLAVAFRSNVVQGTHVPDALATGVRLEAIEAIRAGREDDLTDDERLLARYIRQVVSGTVDDAMFETIENRMGRRGAVEYTIFIAFLQLIMRLYQAFGLPDPPDEEIDRWLQEFRDGTRQVPDFRERIR
jgi:alkylhydroperoxidase family enzyme